MITKGLYNQNFVQNTEIIAQLNNHEDETAPNLYIASYRVLNKIYIMGPLLISRSCLMRWFHVCLKLVIAFYFVLKHYLASSMPTLHYSGKYMFNQVNIEFITILYLHRIDFRR